MISSHIYYRRQTSLPERRQLGYVLSQINPREQRFTSGWKYEYLRNIFLIKWRQTAIPQESRYPDLSVMCPLLFDALPFYNKTSQLYGISENQVGRNLSDRYQDIGFPNAKHILCLQIRIWDISHSLCIYLRGANHSYLLLEEPPKVDTLNWSRVSDLGEIRC